jgi:aspartate/methionine/tyrosine aminotransferase
MATLRVSKRLDGVELSLIRRVLSAAPPGAINLGFGEPDLATPPSIVEAARAAIERPRLGYSPNAGLPELREAVARAYGPEGAGPDGVSVTVGAAEALLVAMLSWVDPGDEVLVPDPGYPAYAAIARIAGATPVPYRLPASTGFQLDPGALEAAMSPRTRLLILNTPANPSGRVMDEAALRTVRDLARSRDLLVVSDEVYRDLRFGGRAPSYLDVEDDAVVVGSLSKSASMTGWRVGWVLGPPERIRWMTVTHQYAVTCAPTHSQWAALAAFEAPARRALEAWVDVLERRRDLLCELVERRLGWRTVRPEGTFYVLVEAAPGGGSLELAMRLLERARVITIPGEAFGREAEGFLRLSFSLPEEDIREAVDRIARV